MRIIKIPPYLWISASGWFNRVFVALVQLCSIPILYHATGLNNFAIFNVVTGLTAWYMLTDFGMGFALQNKISEYRANTKNPDVLLSQALPLLSVLFLLVCLAALLFGANLQHWLFNKIPNQLSPWIFKIVLILYIAQCGLLSIGTKVFFAYQRGAWGYFYSTIGYLLIFCFVLFIHLYHITLSLNSLLLLWVMPLFSAGLVGFLHAFKIQSLRFEFNADLYRSVWKIATQFFLNAFSTNGVLAVDYIIIAKLLSAQDVVTYNIVYKIFMMITVAYSTFLTALWPILSEAYVQKTSQSLQSAEKKIRKSIVVGEVYVILATAALWLFRKPVVALFGVQQKITLSTSLILIFGLYGMLRIWIDTYNTAILSRNIVKFSLIATPIQAVLAICGMIFLSRYGLTGTMLGLTLSFLILPTWLTPLIHYKSKKRK